MVEKDKHVPEGVPEFRWSDLPSSYKVFIFKMAENIEELSARVKKLEDHTEIHKESFNDFN